MFNFAIAFGEFSQEGAFAGYTNPIAKGLKLREVAR
jgi:hypothetical protein